MGFIKKYLLAFIALSTCLSLMASCTASPATPPAADGEEPAIYHMEIDLLGTKSEFSLDSQGRLKTEVKLSSADGRVSLSLNEDAILLGKDEVPLQSISVSIDSNPPPPPKEAIIVGSVYDFRPEGANFNPFIMLTFGYSPEELPEGVREGDVYIGYYQDTEWEMLRYKNIDTGDHRVTTMIDRFGKYAVLAPIAKREGPASEVPSVPAERVDVVYFYRTPRCYVCNYAEEMTRLAIETYFEDELASGKVTFEAVEIGPKENAAVVEKYGAFTSSLFINTVRDGAANIEPVMDIWFVLGDDEAFAEVIKSKIETSLKEVG